MAFKKQVTAGDKNPHQGNINKHFWIKQEHTKGYNPTDIEKYGYINEISIIKKLKTMKAYYAKNPILTVIIELEK